MIILAAWIGLLIGALLNGLADYLPRFAASRAEALASPHFTPALWLALARRPYDAIRLGVELLSAVFIACLWQQFGLSWQFGFFSASYAFFLLIALIDIQYRLVLNIFTYPVIAGTLLVHILFLQQSIRGALVGGVLTFAIFFMTAWLRPGDLGGGDIKLATLIGIAFGFPGVLWALIVGAGLGGAVAIYLLFTRRNIKLHMPYAPFLCLGAMAALLYNPFLTLMITNR